MPNDSSPQMNGVYVGVVGKAAVPVCEQVVFEAEGGDGRRVDVERGAAHDLAPLLQVRVRRVAADRHVLHLAPGHLGPEHREAAAKYFGGRS